jgi:hypothetical protein
MRTESANLLLSQDFHSLEAGNFRPSGGIPPRGGDDRPRGRVPDGPAAGRCARFLAVKRAVAAIASIWALMLVAAPAALADQGVGLAGPTTDKTVTFFCFGVMGFFVLLVVGLSLLQGRLDKRKQQRQSDLSRFN